MLTKESLRGYGIFSGVNSLELEKVANIAERKEYEAGSVIFDEGDPAEEFLILKEGKVALQMQLPRGEGQNTQRITVDIVTSGEVVGWSTVVEPYKYAFRAVCLQNVKAVSIGGDKLRQLLWVDSRIGYAVLSELIKVVASRLHGTARVLISERVLT